MDNALAKNKSPFSIEALQVYAITILFYSISYTLLMILPFYSLSFGASKSGIGLIMGATMFASMFFRPVAGKVIDSIGTKKVIISALFLLLISLTGYFIPNLIVFGIMRLIQGIVASFFSMAMQIYSMNLLSEEARGEGLSLYSLSSMLPSTFAPALALYFKDIIPIYIIFIFLLIIGFLNFIFGMMIPFNSVETPKQVKKNIELSNRKRDWKNHKLLVTSTIMLLASISNGAIFTFLPLYLNSRKLNYGEVYFLTQTVVLVLCRFVGRKFIPSDGNLSKKKIILLLLFVSYGNWLICSFTKLPVLLLAAFFNGVGFSMLYPTLLTYISFSVLEEEKGFFIGLFISAADFGYAIGALVMGFVADVLSYKSMYYICSSFALLAILLVVSFKEG